MNIAAGATPGEFGYGSSDDALINAPKSNVLSTISKISIVGGLRNPDNGSGYGFVAQYVQSVVLSGSKTNLRSGPKNDFLYLGGLSDTTVHEIGAQPPD